MRPTTRELEQRQLLERGIEVGAGAVEVPGGELGVAPHGEPPRQGRGLGMAREHLERLVRLAARERDLRLRDLRPPARRPARERDLGGGLGLVEPVQGVQGLDRLLAEPLVIGAHLGRGGDRRHRAGDIAEREVDLREREVRERELRWRHPARLLLERLPALGDELGQLRRGPRAVSGLAAEIRPLAVSRKARSISAAG